jgi:ribonuclease R
MLAANTAVAMELERNGVPGLFRIHDPPRERDIHEFRLWARRALGLRPGHLASRPSVNHFLAGIHDDPLREIVAGAFLRALPRAGYAGAARGHFGLGKDAYSHFTSPIRRYPDLVVHQQLWQHDSGGAVRSQPECQEIAVHCTQAEANNDEAYFAALDRLKVRYIRDMQERAGRLLYEGVVARLLPEGLLVSLPEVGMYGLLPREALGPEEFRFSAHTQSLRGTRSGKTFRCGHVVFVEVQRADTVKGMLLLRPVAPRPRNPNSAV